MRLQVFVDEREYETSEANPDDRWDRPDTDRELRDIWVENDNRWGDFDLDVEVGQKVWVVYSRFSSGDTFGHDAGYTQIIDVFASEDEANSLVQTIEQMNQLHTVNHNGRDYYISGRLDYFGNQDYAGVWECIVRKA